MKGPKRRMSSLDGNRFLGYTIFRHLNRGVAQFGSAPALGAGGRRFKSCRPDHLKDRFDGVFDRRIFFTGLLETLDYRLS